MNIVEYIFDRTHFDTGFWDDPDEQTIWQYNGQTYAGNEVNYIGQGMFGAARGQSWEDIKNTIIKWKTWAYWDSPSEAELFWARWGYDQYKILQKMYETKK